MGAVDGLIGATEGKVSLALLGLALAGGAISLRWRQIQRAAPSLSRPAVVLYLPDAIASPLTIWSDAESAPPLPPEAPSSPLKNSDQSPQ
ncbi:hypothetical protein [Nodosilinea sp. P-1105]|uniref:hypothetical protein n=1 Tax=Nodosilinea sp. P-1105 TaxID=2546229 RepID=UPI00146EAFFB|nr:hypothetical protein [Nodosilinea sp. P-1105]NMF85121.1 hypothetical protein [Nodosilinea sp. P-1105]